MGRVLWFLIVAVTVCKALVAGGQKMPTWDMLALDSSLV